MNGKFFAGLVLALLLLPGCRGVGPVAPGVANTPGVSATASAVPVEGAGVTAAAAPGTPAGLPETGACPVTVPVLETPPQDDAVMGTPQPGYFYINEDHSIWASAAPPGLPGAGPWRARPEGQKVGWFRPAGATLAVTGRRLDGPAEPLRAELPCCYPTRFQASGLYFPAPGCWEVTALAGESRLTVVVEVAP